MHRLAESAITREILCTFLVSKHYKLHNARDIKENTKLLSRRFQCLSCLVRAHSLPPIAAIIIIGVIASVTYFTTSF